MSNAKILTIIVVGLLLTPTADAARCKYQVNDTDKFTKVLTRWTKWNPLMSEWHFSRIHHVPFVSVHSVDDDAHLLVKVESYIQQMHPPDELYLENYFVVWEGTPLLIIMEDESVVELHALEDVRASTQTSGDDVDGFKTSGTAVLKYSLSDATREALAAQPAKTLRIITHSEEYEFEVQKKSVNDIAVAVECGA